MTGMAQISKKPLEPKTLSTDAKVPGFGDVLKNRDFLFLWLGQIFSQLPDKVFIILAVALMSAHFKEAGASMQSAFFVAHSMPAILFGSIAGVFVDRWSKKNVLVFSNVLRGILVLLLPLFPDSFVYILLLTFLISTLTQFFAPAETSAIPLILPRKDLLIANSLFTATMSASIVFGFALGYPALALVGGADYGHWLVGGSYLVSGLILSLVRTGEESNRDSEKTSPWADLKEGLDYIRGNNIVQAALIQLLVLYSLLAALNILSIRLTKKLGLPDEQFGFLLAATGVGFAIGTWGLGRYGQRFARSRLAATGSLVIALTLGAIAFVSNVWGVLALCVLMGSAAALVMAPMQTAIQEETPEDLRGKVFGLQNNVVNIASTVPMALAGIAVDGFGLQPVILGLSAVSLAAAFISQKTRPVNSN
jgi:predicted MFS family arabinose efflux permease